LKDLRPAHQQNGLVFVHDTPAAPGSWRYVNSRAEADASFAAHPNLRVAFFGHSHKPGIWTRSHSEKAEPGKVYGLNQPMLVNVGSVGQSRDGDPRACYVVMDEEAIRFIRVPYPVEQTQAKLRRIPELGEAMADRLGRAR